ARRDRRRRPGAQARPARPLRLGAGRLARGAGGARTGRRRQPRAGAAHLRFFPRQKMKHFNGFQPAASAPKSAEMHFAMFLTLSRLAAGPVVAALILWAATETYADPQRATLIFIAAGLLFGAAALTDWLDGLVARRQNTVTPLGAALDHCADKVLVAC